MKISYKDAAYICGYKKNHTREKLFCDWTLEKKNDNAATLDCDIKWWVYLLMFIPVHVLEFFYVLWDGGLKDYTLQDRHVHHHNITGLTNDGENTTFGRAKVIFERG